MTEGRFVILCPFLISNKIDKGNDKLGNKCARHIKATSSYNQERVAKILNASSL